MDKQPEKQPEKQYQDMTPTELRNALADYHRQNTPSGPQHPEAPGCSHLDPEIREAASTIYGESLMAKQPSALTSEERAWIAQSIAAWQATRNA